MVYIKTNIDNLRINYIKKGKGKSVLIIPGWGTTIDVYTTLINSISKYACVYCLDMPGFGESDELDDSWDIDDYVTFITKFIKKQNIKELDIIGHSNGGRITIKLLNKNNLEFKVGKAILIGSAGIVHKKSLMKKAKVKMFKIGKKILQIKIINNRFPNMLGNLQNKFGSEDYRNASPIMKQTLVKLVNEDLKECLINVKVPTLLIWGENDTATPISDAVLMEKLIPNAGLVKVKGCSHYVFLEQPVYVNKVIETFINGGNK